MPADTSSAADPVAAANLSGAGLLPVAPPNLPPGASVLHVGANETYTTLASALAASRNGDTLLVDAGTYTDDFAYVTTAVSIIGVGGMVNLVAASSPANGKAILCVDADCTIENVSFSGCKVPDQNGAGIRYEGGNLTLRNCSFHDNENGLMSAPVPGGTLLIQHCDFSNNGNGNGLTHNLYAGAIQQLTVEDSRFTGVSVGHESKSRAFNTTITGNLIADGPVSTASYSIDLPDGGKAVVTGNLIEKGSQAENQSAIHFGGEGIPYGGSSLLVQGNQITNDRGPEAVAVLNQTAIPVTVTDNSLTRFDAARIALGPAQISGNLDSPAANGTGTPLADSVLVGVLSSNTQVFTDALDHQVNLTGSNTAVQGGAGRLQVLATAGHIIAVGGAGGLDFTEADGSGGNQVTTAAGSVNTIQASGQDVIDSEGTDAITTGIGNITGVAAGTAVIADGTGDNQWYVSGTAQVTGGGGAPRFTLGQTGSLNLGGTLAWMNIGSNGGTAAFDVVVGGNREQATLSGGSFNATTQDGLVAIGTAGGGDGVAMQLGAGKFLVISGGSDTIRAGGGDALVQVWGAAQIHAGTGALAVYGRGLSGASVWGAGGTTLIGGDTGGITYHGGAQDSTVQAVLANITLLGGAGRLTVQAGSRQAITGGSGGLTLTETAQSGANGITTAAGSVNVVDMNGDTMESWGQDTITQLGNNNVLTVHGDALVRGGAGDSHTTVTGRATLIGQGGDWVTLTPGAAAAVQAGTHTFVSSTGADLRLAVPALDAIPASTAALGGITAAAGATATIHGGSASIAVYEDRLIRITTAAGAGGTQVSVDGGASSIAACDADSIHTGGGSAWVGLCAAGAEVWAGSGQTGIKDCDWTWGDKQTIHGGDGAVSIDPGCGDITFTGGAGDAVFGSAGGHLRVQGGSGRTSLTSYDGGVLDYTGGSGDANLLVSSKGGSITFGTGATAAQELDWGAAVSYAVTAASGGTGVINGFRPGTDSLHLRGTAIAAQTVDGAGTTITTTAGATIMLAGVSAPVTAVVDAAPAAAQAVDGAGATIVPGSVPASAAAGDTVTASAQAMPTSGADTAGAPAAPAPTDAAAFTVVTAGTGQAESSDGDAYAGPVAGLQRQFIWSGAGGVVVTASTPDVFLHGGAGDDALATKGGSNVLDGGAGSNFLVGGTGADGGTDTFFVDGRGAGTTWSTLVNFHHGDALTLWGFQPGTSTLTWAADEGAAGYRGATLHAEMAGAGTGVDASATLAGLNLSDAAKLTMLSGVVGGTPYLYISYTG